MHQRGWPGCRRARHAGQDLIIESVGGDETEIRGGDPEVGQMGEPPPTATTAGRPLPAASAATASAPAATSPVVGLACTSLNTVTGMPLAASASATLATTAVRARP
jgi:hypothetical protein